jgi:site-specific DNA-methyltransferase (adenine-specific)
MDDEDSLKARFKSSSGQTAIAALKSDRHFAGYDINKDYVRLAERRTKEYVNDKATPKLLDLRRD